MSASIAIIGGSGFANLARLADAAPVEIDTPYGATSARPVRGRLAGTEVWFLARHGQAHHLPPHCINYRANLWALHALGARQVIGLAAVGGISGHCAPLQLCVPDQLIDYTHGREHSLYDGASGRVEHIDMTEPYCATLREALLHAGASIGTSIVGHGVYGATQGPRLETAAEIQRMARDGCDLVGMTGMPEAAIARELGLCYACLAFVVNWAAGRSEGVITMETINANLARCADQVQGVLEAFATSAAGLSEGAAAAS